MSIGPALMVLILLQKVPPTSSITMVFPLGPSRHCSRRHSSCRSHDNIKRCCIFVCTRQSGRAAHVIRSLWWCCFHLKKNKFRFWFMEFERISCPSWSNQTSFCQCNQWFLRCNCHSLPESIQLKSMFGETQWGLQNYMQIPDALQNVYENGWKIREWELANMEDYDTARVGGSALHAALKRNLNAEVSHWQKQCPAGFCNDFEKFSDSLDIKTLIDNALEEGFPLSSLRFWYSNIWHLELYRQTDFRPTPLISSNLY